MAKASYFLALSFSILLALVVVSSTKAQSVSSYYLQLVVRVKAADGGPDRHTKVRFINNGRSYNFTPSRCQAGTYYYNIYSDAPEGSLTVYGGILGISSPEQEKILSLTPRETLLRRSWSIFGTVNSLIMDLQMNSVAAYVPTQIEQRDGLLLPSEEDCTDRTLPVTSIALPPTFTATNILTTTSNPKTSVALPLVGIVGLGVILILLLGGGLLIRRYFKRKIKNTTVAEPEVLTIYEDTDADEMQSL